jgi:N-acetylglucosamine-6-sulfatase
MRPGTTRHWSASTLNEYGVAAHRGYVPPGWDRWVALAMENVQYYDYDLSVDGAIHSYGHRPADYATDVLAQQAASFIRSTTGPLFLYFAPPGPHDPAIPAPGDGNTFPDLQPSRPASYNEADVSDKPAWVRSRPVMTAGRGGYIDHFALDQYRSLLSVDRAVGQILDALSDTGRLSNTFIVFMSDNGFLWGEHRLMGKEAPYEESIRVPMVIRYDPLTGQTATNPQLVLNMDLAPTFAALAGVGAPGAEGHSLLPLLRSPGAPWRTDFLIEHERGVPDIPSYCAVRTQDEKYVLYSTGAQELYELSSDPYELHNVASDPLMQGRVKALRTRVDQLCRPRPPGFPGQPGGTP